MASITPILEVVLFTKQLGDFLFSKSPGLQNDHHQILRNFLVTFWSQSYPNWKMIRGKMTWKMTKIKFRAKNIIRVTQRCLIHLHRWGQVTHPRTWSASTSEQKWAASQHCVARAPEIDVTSSTASIKILLLTPGPWNNLVLVHRPNL